MQNNIPRKLPSGPLCFSAQGFGGLRRFRTGGRCLSHIPIGRVFRPGLWAWLRARPRTWDPSLWPPLLLAACKPSPHHSTHTPEKAKQCPNVNPSVISLWLSVVIQTTDSDLQTTWLAPLQSDLLSPLTLCSHMGLHLFPQNKPSFFLPQDLCTTFS